MPNWGSSITIFLALAIAASLASPCLPQDFAPPPGPPADGVCPGVPPGMNQDPNAAGPPLPLDPFPADPGLPPVAPASPALPPGVDPDALSSGKIGFGDLEGGGMRGFGGGMHPADSLQYRTIWFPTVAVRGQASDFQMLGQDLSLTHPLWTDPLNALSLAGGVRNRLIDTGAVLPDTGQPVPSELWNADLGLRYARQLDDGWITGGGVSIGSASDHPFASVREMYVGMNAMLRIPQGENNAWIFMLVYSPTGQLNFPLPMVAFSYNPSPQLHANIGLPLQVTWRPSEDWQLQASYMLISTIHLKAEYRFTDRLIAVAAYDWSNEAYSLVDRPEQNDRFFLYDQRVSLGLQVLFFRHWTGTLSAGYVFDRYLFQGTSFSAGSSDRVNLGAGPFVSLGLGGRY
jgi:hypothetical protein